MKINPVYVAIFLFVVVVAFVSIVIQLGEETCCPPSPIGVEGSGTQKTTPFDIPGGDFNVSISGNGDGNVIASLELRGGDFSDSHPLFNEIADGKYRYETVVYGLEAGSYYLDMLNKNAWLVTFVPLQ